MGDAAAYAKDEAAILRTQQLKNQIAKQNKYINSICLFLDIF